MLFERAITVVVPAFHEEAHIAGVIETMPDFVDRIIVVDDGSRDETSAQATKASANRRKGSVEILRHPIRRGVGAAIATGYARALVYRGGDGQKPHRDDVIAVMAGDGQMHPDDLKAVVRPVATGSADYVKGNRFEFSGARRAMGTPRYIGGQVFSRLTSLAIGQRIDDSQCGFTAISRGMLRSIDLPGFWPSFGYPNDLLGQLAARRARIVEVVVRPVYGNEISKLRLRHLPAIFFLIARAAARRSRSTSSSVSSSAVTHVDDAAKKELREDSAVSS